MNGSAHFTHRTSSRWTARYMPWLVIIWMTRIATTRQKLPPFLSTTSSIAAASYLSANRESKIRQRQTGRLPHERELTATLSGSRYFLPAFPSLILVMAAGLTRMAETAERGAPLALFYGVSSLYLFVSWCHAAGNCFPTEHGLLAYYPDP